MNHDQTKVVTIIGEYNNNFENVIMARRLALNIEYKIGNVMVIFREFWVI